MFLFQGITQVISQTHYLLLLFYISLKYLSIYHSNLLEEYADSYIINIITSLSLIIPIVLSVIEFSLLMNIQDFTVFKVMTKDFESHQNAGHFSIILISLLLISWLILQARVEYDNWKHNESMLKSFIGCFRKSYENPIDYQRISGVISLIIIIVILLAALPDVTKIAHFTHILTVSIFVTDLGMLLTITKMKKITFKGLFSIKVYPLYEVHV